MGNINLNQKRAKTMVAKLGKDACELIGDAHYLPMFRARQKDDEAAFAKLVEYVHDNAKITAKANYFAKACGREMWNKTKAMMIGLIERAKSLAAEVREKAKRAAEDLRVKHAMNIDGRKRFEKMRSDTFAKKFINARE